jgi:hypothetical protein
MILTASKDTTLKIFQLKVLLESSQMSFKIIRSFNLTKYLVQINYLLFGTYSNDSS